MLLPPVEYARPRTLEDALRLLRERPEAHALAGGQSLVNMMKLRLAAPEVLVDIGSLAELRPLARAGETLRLGALVTHARVVDSPEVAAARPVLAEVARTIADVQVRNRATVGGNVCHNDPANHFPALLAALGARMVVAGADGERAVPVDAFFHGVFTTAVGPGELLTRVDVPALRAGEGDGWATLGTGKDGLGIVHVAASLRLAGGRIESARIAVGCVGGVPARPEAAERALAGAEPEPDAVAAAVAGIGGELDPPSDVHASSEYRRHLATVLAERAVLRAAERAAA